MCCEHLMYDLKRILVFLFLFIFRDLWTSSASNQYKKVEQNNNTKLFNIGHIGKANNVCDIVDLHPIFFYSFYMHNVHYFRSVPVKESIFFHSSGSIS